MKNKILEIFNKYKELGAEELLNLNNDTILNSEFKISLNKDKEKGVKPSDTKFYLAKNENVIKFQFDEDLNKLLIFPSKDISDIKDEMKAICKLPLNKIEMYLVSSFVILQKDLHELDFIKELTRKERYRNNNTYQDLVVFSYIKGEK